MLLDNIPSVSGNHNAGDIHFGKDGYLYVTIGDSGCDYTGASACGMWNNAATYRNALVGKVVRITADGEIPIDNPHQGPGTSRCNLTGRTIPGDWCQEIFATGLRNPFRFAFDDDAPTTRFFINDVGQDHWEEINQGAPGADYGWNQREGHCAVASYTDCGPPPAGITNPALRLRPHRRLHLDHRRRVRARRSVAGSVRQQLSVRRFRLREAFPARA